MAKELSVEKDKPDLEVRYEQLSRVVREEIFGTEEQGIVFYLDKRGGIPNPHILPTILELLEISDQLDTYEKNSGRLGYHNSLARARFIYFLCLWLDRFTTHEVKVFHFNKLMAACLLAKEYEEAYRLTVDNAYCSFQSLVLDCYQLEIILRYELVRHLAELAGAKGDKHHIVSLLKSTVDLVIAPRLNADHVLHVHEAHYVADITVRLLDAYLGPSRSSGELDQEYVSELMRFSKALLGDPVLQSVFPDSSLRLRTKHAELRRVFREVSMRMHGGDPFRRADPTRSSLRSKPPVHRPPQEGPTPLTP